MLYKIIKNGKNIIIDMFIKIRYFNIVMEMIKVFDG